MADASALFADAMFTAIETGFDDLPLLGSTATTLSVALPGLILLPNLRRLEFAPGCALKSISLSVFEPRLRMARTVAGLSSVRRRVVVPLKARGLTLTLESTGAVGTGAPGSG